MKFKYVLDPRRYHLTRVMPHDRTYIPGPDYTFVSNFWGDMFYRGSGDLNVGWERAREHCEMEGAYLPVPRSMPENRFIYS